MLDAGDYYLAAGHNAHNALNNILAKKGYTPDNTAGRMSSEGDAALCEVVFTSDKTDAERFSRSPETGKPIGNLLDFMDINRYENRGNNQVTYVSRADWSGTWPKEPVHVSVSGPAMMADLSTLAPMMLLLQQKMVAIIKEKSPRHLRLVNMV